MATSPTLQRSPPYNGLLSTMTTSTTSTSWQMATSLQLLPLYNCFLPATANSLQRPPLYDCCLSPVVTFPPTDTSTQTATTSLPCASEQSIHSLWLEHLDNSHLSINGHLFSPQWWPLLYNTNSFMSQRIYIHSYFNISANCQTSWQLPVNQWPNNGVHKPHFSL